MKKALLPLLLCVIFLLSGCAPRETVGVDSSELEPFAIGGLVPLSEAWVDYGTSARNGAALAVSEINATGGVNGFRLVMNFQDSKRDASALEAGYKKLKANGINVLLGGVFSDEAEALSALTEKDGILTLMTSAGSGAALGKGENTFRLCQESKRLGTAAATFIAEKKIGRVAAVIYSDDGFDSEATAEGFLSACAAQNIHTTPIKIGSRATEEDVIRSIRDVGVGEYDVIFLALSPEYTRIFMEEFVGANETILTSRLPEGGLDRNKVLIISSYFEDDKNEVIRNFISTYEEAYGTAPDSYAADAYDAVYAIAQAIKRAGITPDGNETNWSAELIKAMTEIEVRGVSGNISWTTDGESTRASEIREFRDGIFALYRKEEASSGS